MYWFDKTYIIYINAVFIKHYKMHFVAAMKVCNVLAAVL